MWTFTMKATGDFQNLGDVARMLREGAASLEDGTVVRDPGVHEAAGFILEDERRIGAWQLTRAPQEN